MKRVIRFVFMSLFLVFIGLACKENTDNESQVSLGLAKGIRQDSLFLGIKFGMTREDFYTHCWELNKEGVLIHGSRNNTAEYRLNDLKYKAIMNFYPDFVDGKIYEMPVTFTYIAWAPWNKHLFSDSLQQDVINLYEKWYDIKFLERPNKYLGYGKAYVGVNGNRQITVFKQDDMVVKAVFTDLVAKNKE